MTKELPIDVQNNIELLRKDIVHYNSCFTLKLTIYICSRGPRQKEM